MAWISQRRAVLALHLIGLVASIAWIGLYQAERWLLAPKVLTVALAGLLTWGSVTLIILCVNLGRSGARVGELLRASARAAVPGVWFVPSYWLLSMLNTALAAVGILMAANATRLLLGNVWIRRTHKRRKGREERELLFHATPSGDRAWGGGVMAVILGAVILEIGLGAMVTGHLIAALLLGCGVAAMWTASLIARDAYLAVSHAVSWPHAAWAVVLTLLLMSFPESSTGWGASWGAVEAGQRIWNGVSAVLPEARPKPAATTLANTKKIAMPVKNGVPGVILRPKPAAAQKAILSPWVARARMSLARPVKFPFTGEYHLYPRSSQRVEYDAAVIAGTPLDAAYSTLTGGALITEAVQELYPPLDFAECGKIEVTLISNEGNLASASLQLLVAGGVREVGSDLFGMRPPGAEEILEFTVPPEMRNAVAHAIRLVFQHGPLTRHVSSKIAVQGFSLFPRQRR